MKNALNSVKIARPSTNAFDLTHDVKLSCNMGDLIPVLAMECIPGDRVRIGCENLVRLAPMLAPLMSRIDVRIEYFFCPYRLLWANSETWLSNGGDQPQVDTPDPLPAFPFFNYNAVGDGTHRSFNDERLLDYMGLPDPNQCPLPNASETVSAMPFAAYQKIYDDYYRDQNLISSFINKIPLIDGDNSGLNGLFGIRKRAWEADYFTKALPFAQKGQPVDLPLGEVELKNTTDFPSMQQLVRNQDGTLSTDHDVEVISPGADTGVLGWNNAVGPSEDELLFDPNGTLVVGATTLNDLRTAETLQKWLEINARGGTRYSELIRAHYGVSPEDSRLQRPEYIVGVKNPIQISEVLNMTGTDDAPQGNMSGHGVSYNSGNYGKYFCKEHGYIIGIMSVMPRTNYQQGIPKHFLKITDPTELAWPSFGHLGEQSILNREIMAFDANGSSTWGYTPRYMEYKTLPNRVCGEFRTSLDFWHMGRIFDPLTPPQLNEDFVNSDPTNRIWSVTDSGEDHLYCQLLHKIMAVRALPFYGTPSF